VEDGAHLSNTVTVKTLSMPFIALQNINKSTHSSTDKVTLCF